MSTVKQKEQDQKPKEKSRSEELLDSLEADFQDNSELKDLIPSDDDPTAELHNRDSEGKEDIKQVTSHSVKDKELTEDDINEMTKDEATKIYLPADETQAPQLQNKLIEAYKLKYGADKEKLNQSVNQQMGIIADLETELSLTGVMTLHHEIGMDPKTKRMAYKTHTYAIGHASNQTKMKINNMRYKIQDMKNQAIKMRTKQFITHKESDEIALLSKNIPLMEHKVAAYELKCYLGMSWEQYLTLVTPDVNLAFKIIRMRETTAPFLDAELLTES